MIPGIGSVRWICAKPTITPATAYSIGTYGWMIEEAEKSIGPAVREHNRRIAEENAALMDRYAQLLGVKKP